MEKEIAALKKLIETNGPDYLTREPYEVYQCLLDEKVSRTNAALILFTLVSETAEKAKESEQKELSDYIRKNCCLQKKKADQLAEMYCQLFSRDHLEQWKDKAESGLKEFCEKNWNFQWDCSKEWHQGSGFVECTCEITAEFQTDNPDIMKERFAAKLQENPFLTASEISDDLKSVLSEMLDDDVDEFVNADDYYEPWMEDYDCQDVLEKFARQYGMKLLDHSCDGDTSDWESDR